MRIQRHVGSAADICRPCIFVVRTRDLHRKGKVVIDSIRAVHSGLARKRHLNRHLSGVGFPFFGYHKAIGQRIAREGADKHDVARGHDELAVRDRRGPFLDRPATEGVAGHRIRIVRHIDLLAHVLFRQGCGQLRQNARIRQIAIVGIRYRIVDRRPLRHVDRIIGDSICYLRFPAREGIARDASRVAVGVRCASKRRR